MNANIKQTSSLATISLVSGILGWTLVPWLGSLVAIITGHMARAEIRRNPTPWKAMAWPLRAWSCWARGALTPAGDLALSCSSAAWPRSWPGGPQRALIRACIRLARPPVPPRRGTGPRLGLKRMEAPTAPA
jgi:hypothetical protein